MNSGHRVAPLLAMTKGGASRHDTSRRHSEEPKATKESHEGYSRVEDRLAPWVGPARGGSGAVIGSVGIHIS